MMAYLMWWWLDRIGQLRYSCGGCRKVLNGSHVNAKASDHAESPARV